MQGKVKFFNQEKGFGFIVGNDGVERFVGVRDIVGSDLPKNGSIVDFDHQDGKKGPKATKVKITAPSTSGDSNQSNRKDDRVVCTSCDRRMVPRVVFNRGTPSHNICPFCGKMFKDLSPGCLSVIAVFAIPSYILWHMI